jgi:hypothetical protein
MGGAPTLAFFRLCLEADAAAVEAGAPCGALAVECWAEDVAAAGHAHDARIVTQLLRALAAACAQGSAGLGDITRLIDRSAPCPPPFPY